MKDIIDKIFDQVMDEVCDDPVRRFAELILEQERKEAAEHYLKLIRDCVATEREQCAQVCEQLLAESESAYEETEFEKQLRLLSLKLVEIPTKNIAAAIRARGDKHEQFI